MGSDWPFDNIPAQTHVYIYNTQTLNTQPNSGGADPGGAVQGRHAQGAAEPAEGGGPAAGAGAQDFGGGWVSGW